jgi:hypothetical protein
MVSRPLAVVMPISLVSWYSQVAGTSCREIHRDMSVVALGHERGGVDRDGGRHNGPHRSASYRCCALPVTIEKQFMV